jgi:hypothetical protein
MTAKPWKLRWKLARPRPNGQRTLTDSYASESAAKHEGQRLWDAGGCVSVTLTNDTLPAVCNRVVAEWPPRGRKRR